MKNNLIISVLMLGLLTNGWAVFYFTLPFYKELIVIGAFSLLIMAAINERFVFLYAITISLVYGAFLTAISFAQQLSGEIQIRYIYSHLLFTSFHLIYWIMMNLLKNIGYQNSELKQQVKLLQKYRKVTKVLTLTEFKDQAEWLLKSSTRNQEEVYFLKYIVDYPKKKVKQNLQETLEKVALQSIRQKYDLVSSETGSIYLLLKNTSLAGTEVVKERFWEKSHAELNFVDPPFKVEKEQVRDIEHLNQLLGQNL